MFTISSILVPTDFSECAKNALNYAVEIAKSTNCTIHLIYVVEPIMYPADWGYSQVGFVDIENEMIASAGKDLESLATELRSSGVTVVSEVLSGRASERIIEYAQNHAIDMISIATHGRSGLEHFLFGSTTERVLRKATCPVLTVRVPDHKKK